MEQMDWKRLMTVRAYQMRLILQDLYELRDMKQARKDFMKWCEWVKTTAAKAGHELLAADGKGGGDGRNGIWTAFLGIGRKG